jgi:hypothetical protein
MVLYLRIFGGKKHSIMKNIKYFILGLLVIQGASAQLKPTYKDGNQVLNGLKLRQKKKSSQNPGILILAWRELIPHLKISQLI